MAFPIGNQYWKHILNKAGRRRRFQSPQELAKEADDYFQWIEENPLTEYKAFGYTGKVVVQPMPVIRAMTISQFCGFAGISYSAWINFKKAIREATLKSEPAKHEFEFVIESIENVIFNQKFQAAAGNLLNANIISRELGLMVNEPMDDTMNIDFKEERTYLNKPEGQSKKVEPQKPALRLTSGDPAAGTKKIVKVRKRKN